MGTISPIIGPIVTGDDIRVAMETTIKTWLPTYLEEYCRQKDLPPGSFPYLRATHASAEMKLPDVTHQLPLLITSVNTTHGTPAKHGDGHVRLEWTANVGILVSSTTHEATLRNAHAYTACIRALVMQHPSLGGVVTHTTFEAEGTGIMLGTSERTTMGGVLVFYCSVNEASDFRKGPKVVPADPKLPFGAQPTVQTVDIKTQKAV